MAICMILELSLLDTSDTLSPAPPTADNYMIVNISVNSRAKKLDSKYALSLLTHFSMMSSGHLLTDKNEKLFVITDFRLLITTVCEK